MQLSILMPALRQRPWQRMQQTLTQQARQISSDIEILVDVDEGRVTSGVKRQRLMNRSQGRYITFVDDDDEISEDYIQSLFLASLEGMDVVTFRIQFIHKDPRRPKFRNTEHWTFRLADDNRPKGIMAANHLCVWRRELAVRIAWCPELGNGDDQLWYKPLLASGLVQTETHVDRILYRYLYNHALTVNQDKPHIRRRCRYVGSGLRCFWHGEEIVIEVGDDRNDNYADTVLVRDRNNIVQSIPRRDLKLFHVISLK